MDCVRHALFQSAVTGEARAQSLGYGQGEGAEWSDVCRVSLADTSGYDGWAKCSVSLADASGCDKQDAPAEFSR